MKRLLLIALVLVTAFVPALIASARPPLWYPEPEPDTFAGRTRAWQLTQSWMGEGDYSGVIFEEDAFEDLFEKDYFPMVRFGLCWYPVENVSLGLYTGGLYEAGHAIGTVTGEESEEDSELYVLPVMLDLRLRFRFLEDQLIVPSLRAGGDYWYFQELNDYADNVEGDKTGYHWGGDLAFLLDPIDPRAAHRMAKTWNVDDTYLVLGYQSYYVGEGEDGLKFSGSAYSVGIRFETAGRAP